MRPAVDWGWALLALGASVFLYWFALSAFIVGVCGVSDTGGRFPADASPQGWVCGESADHLFTHPGLVTLMLSALLGLVLSTVCWRSLRPWGRYLAPLVLLLMPLVTLGVLSLPPDKCSASAQRTEPAYSCRTTNE